MAFVSPEFGFAPWRLSGTVYGTLLNDAAALAALGPAVHAAPYKAPPRAPVLYLKPRNTLVCAADGTIAAPMDGEVELGAAIGIVISRPACRVAAADAPSVIAGYVLVVDCSVPHHDFYRPNVRLRARDRSCLIGPVVAPRDAFASGAEALPITVSIDGRPVRTVRDVNWVRPIAQLVHDVTDFMTLAPGDVLLLGVAHGAPRARAGRRFTAEAPGLGRVTGEVVAERDQAAA